MDVTGNFPTDSSSLSACPLCTVRYRFNLNTQELTGKISSYSPLKHESDMADTTNKKEAAKVRVEACVVTGKLLDSSKKLWEWTGSPM